MRHAPALLALFLLSSSCAGGASATFPVGVEVSLDASEIMLPPELREEDPSGDRVRSLPCGPGGMCPSSAEVPVTCEADRCDPAAQTISSVVGDADIDELAGDLGELFMTIDTIAIQSIEFNVERNTLTIPTEPIEVFWGPVGAVDVESPGVNRLGTVPAIAAGSTEMGAIALDPAGNAAFTEYFETTAHQFRFFIRSTVDLDPGQRWPEGAIDVQVRMSVRVEGSLL